MSPMVRLPLTIEHALLGFLRQQPRHGYEIHQRLASSRELGLVWRLKQSQLYAILGKLERAGLIEATLEPQEPRPPRKVFHLTRKGREAFDRWLRAPVSEGRGLRLEFLAKLFFARQEEPEVAWQLIEAQRVACQGWLVAQRRRAAAGEETFEVLVHRFRLGQIEAMLGWLDECQQALAAPGR
jgi:PadR family transcriptional regulator, regulatory protein AphA